MIVVNGVRGQNDQTVCFYSKLEEFVFGETYPFIKTVLFLFFGFVSFS